MDNSDNKEKKTTLTLSITESVRTGLKIYALQHNTTVSALLEKWYHAACESEDGNTYG